MSTAITPVRVHRRPRIPSVLMDLKDPLFRNGYALALASISTAAIGLVYWVLVAHRFSPAIVGRNSVAIMALQFLGSAAQLNLTNALIRFVPHAGVKVRRLVLGTYALSMTVAVLFAVTFLVLVPTVAPGLMFLRSSWPLMTWWVFATAAWSVFVLEDGALTGLRKAPWVPVENAGFSLLKAALVLPLAGALPATGILVSWTAAAAATIVPTNLYIFGRAIPAASRRSPGVDVTIDELIRYVPYDYMASLAWLGATSLLPLLVMRDVGAAGSAYYTLSWTIGYTLYLVSISLGSSLVVEAATSGGDLATSCRHVIAHLAKIMIPAAVVIALGASLILRAFGHRYSSAGAGNLRLLALSAVPFIVISTAVSALRVMRKTRRVLMVDGSIVLLVALISWVLLPHIGIVAVGGAWLVVNSAVAVCLLARPGWWTEAGEQHDQIHPAVTKGWPRTLTGTMLAILAAFPVPDSLRVLRVRAGAREFFQRVRPEVAKALSTYGRPVEERDLGHPVVLAGVSDLSVVLVGDRAGKPLAVVKIPRSPMAGDDLLRQQRVLAELRDDTRLDAWRELLPDFRLLGTGDAMYGLEAAARGIDCARLIDQRPSLEPALSIVALGAVEELHSRTSSEEVLDEAALDDLLKAPLRLLTASSPWGVPPPRQLLAAKRLEERLLASATGRRSALSWVHGDFTPGNVVVDEHAVRVITVLDWGQARRHGLPGLDVALWALAVDARIRRCQIGEVVRPFALGSADAGGRVADLAGNSAEHTGIGLADLVLWTWLMHVSGNLQKSVRYRHHPIWWAANVAPVLEVFER